MVYVVTTFLLYFLWWPFGSLGARPGRRLGAGLERPSAPHHRPGGTRRASSPKARASGGLRLTARTADRRSESPDRLPWGRCGGRLGWRVRGVMLRIPLCGVVDAILEPAYPKGSSSPHNLRPPGAIYSVVRNSISSGSSFHLAFLPDLPRFSTAHEARAFAFISRSTSA